MKFHVLTLFPEMVLGGLNTSILGKAMEKELISINAVNIRDYTLDKHGRVDDYTYGGGAGMLMQAQPVYDAHRAVTGGNKVRTVYVTPQGYPFTQKMAKNLAKEEELVFLCGHYEGIDERVLDEVVTDYVSIGDYVLTGGELPAMVMIDAISRLIPGVLNNNVSAETESFHNDLLEYPQYTRPEIWQEKKVPEVLLSGNQKKITAWRLEQSVAKTQKRRPDLYEKYQQKQAIVKRLSKKKRTYIHMMELLDRGLGEVLYEKDMDILLRFENVYMLNAASEESTVKLIDMASDTDGYFVITQAFVKDILAKRYGYKNATECSQALFTRKEALPVPYKQIKRLDISHLEYVRANYPIQEDRLRGILEAGNLYGAFDEDRLVGFIGMHEEGSMGMLFVEEAFRRKGIAASLESFFVNVQLTNGWTPYCHIIKGNDASMALQEKLGLYFAENPLWWVWK